MEKELGEITATLADVKSAVDLTYEMVRLIQSLQKTVDLQQQSIAMLHRRVEILENESFCRLWAKTHPEE